MSVLHTWMNLSSFVGKKFSNDTQFISHSLIELLWQNNIFQTYFNSLRSKHFLFWSAVLFVTWKVWAAKLQTELIKLEITNESNNTDKVFIIISQILPICQHFMLLAQLCKTTQLSFEDSCCFYWDWLGNSNFSQMIGLVSIKMAAIWHKDPSRRLAVSR